MDKKVDRHVEERQHPDGHRLHFIYDNDAVAESPKPTNAGSPSIVKRVQKLDQGRNDDGSIPIFCHQFSSVEFLPFLFPALFLHQIGMMLQNELVVPDRITQIFCILIDDAKQRSGKNDPAALMLICMSQGKPKRCKRLSAPCGNAEPVDSAWPFCRFPAAA